MINKQVHRSVGRLDFFKETSKHTALFQLKNLDNKVEKYWVFDKLKLDTDKALNEGSYKSSTVLEIAYIETTSKNKKGEKFNKIVDIQPAKDVTELLTGTISNINNTRAEDKKADYVYYCLKNKGEKVVYLYMHKQLANSAWFQKGKSIMVEAYRKPNQGEHEVYEVRSLFSFSK